MVSPFPPRQRAFAESIYLAASFLLAMLQPAAAQAASALPGDTCPIVHVDSAGASATFPAAGPGMSQYLFDWGDGTQTPSSPVNPGIPGRAQHTWMKAGRYSVRALCISADGKTSAWSAPQTITPPPVAQASAPAKTPPVAQASAPVAHALHSLKVLASSAASGFAARDLLGGKGWRSNCHPSADQPEWVTIDLGSPRTIDEIALEPLPHGESFPAAFQVVYCTDAGKTWYPIPRYVFHSYPNPGEETVLLPTGLLCARQIRITATRLAPTAAGYAFGLRGVKLRTSKLAPFFTSVGGSFDADLNNLWNIYGLANGEIVPSWDDWWDGPGGVRACGSTEWHEWDVLKLCWADLPADTNRLRNEIVNMPMDPDGYVWACDAGPLHLNAQKHFTLNAIHILAAYKYYLWTGEPGFFSQTLPEGVQQKTGAKTVLDRLRKEMDYQLGVLDGREGLLRIPDPDYNGAPGSKGTSYWDCYPAGYLSAYPNALFYASVRAMAQVEGIAGDAARRDRLLNLLPLIRERFNQTFWSAEKGRFISTIDANGVPHDYGIVPANLYAIVYGAADPEKAAQVMDWLTGKRIVPGDTSQGADIYHWIVAPRSNTVAIESIQPYWWAGAFSGVLLDPGGWGRWGVNGQNGGALFYLSCYDILARLQILGPDNAFGRFRAILQDFHANELRPDTPGHYGPAGTPAFAVGVSVSFSESGLVPLSMLYGFLGIEPAPDGLHIHPALPSGMRFAGVRDLLYHGSYYTITVRRGIGRPSIRETMKDHFDVSVPDGRATLLPTHIPN